MLEAAVDAARRRSSSTDAISRFTTAAYTATPHTASAASRAPVYHAVRRPWMLRRIRSICFGGAQLVPLAAARANQRFLAGKIHLAPETLHVHIDHVGERIVVLVPHVFGDVGATDDGAGAG